MIFIKDFRINKNMRKSLLFAKKLYEFSMTENVVITNKEYNKFNIT